MIYLTARIIQESMRGVVLLMKRVFTRIGVDEYDNQDGVYSTRGYNLMTCEDFYYLFAGLKIQDVNRFINDMEKKIKELKEELIERDPYAFNIMMSSCYDYAESLDSQYHVLLRNSVFISVYSMVEVVLDSIWKYSKRYYNISYEVSNPKIKGIYKSQLCFKKGLGITMPKKEWRTLEYYNKIRNILVHSQGYIFLSGKNDSKLHKAIRVLNSKGIILKNESCIELNEVACLEFSSFVEVFLRKICSSLPFLNEANQALQISNIESSYEI